MSRVHLSAVITLLSLVLSGCAESAWEVSTEDRVSVITRHLRTMLLSDEVVTGVRTAFGALGADQGSELNTAAFASSKIIDSRTLR